MPKAIIFFERLAYLSLILGIVSTALNWRYSKEFAAQSPILFLLAQVGILGGQIVFIWLIARKRQNWARWIWVALTAAGTAVEVFVVRAGFNNGMAAAIAVCLVYLVSLTATLFLVVPASWAWFRTTQS